MTDDAHHTGEVEEFSEFVEDNAAGAVRPPS